MPTNAMIYASDSQNQSPLFAVYDSSLKVWYEIDAAAWSDLILQADDPDEFAFFCEDCLKLLSLCACPPFEPV